MLRLRRLLPIMLPVLLLGAIRSTTMAQTSDDGRPKTVVYNGQNYLVELSPGGFALKITPQGTPVPIGIVALRTGRINALDPNNYDTVKGVYEAYKAGGSTFAAPATPTLPARSSLPVPAAAGSAASAERTVTFPPEGGAIVKDPDLKADVTFTPDGTAASFVRQSQGPMGAVWEKITASFEGGDQPASAGKDVGRAVGSAAKATVLSYDPHVRSRIGGSSEIWKVSQSTNGGKESTLYESGGYTLSETGRYPEKSLALPVLISVRKDWDVIETQAAAAKQAGQTVQVDFGGDRSLRAKAALDKAVPQ